MSTLVLIVLTNSKWQNIYSEINMRVTSLGSSSQIESAPKTSVLAAINILYELSEFQ
jgi:cell division protein ZapA (FtsZ GTPase activity inhibitor)